jgi:hypothetical protein
MKRFILLLTVTLWASHVSAQIFAGNKKVTPSVKVRLASGSSLDSLRIWYNNLAAYNAQKPINADLIVVTDSIPDVYSLTDGDYGDISISGGGSIFTIDDSSVITQKIAPSAVTGPKIADGNVSRVKLASQSVDSEKVLNGSLLGEDLATQTITGDKLALLTVGSGQIANGAIWGSKIPVDGIVKSHILDEAVDTDKIQDNTILVGDLSSSFYSTGTDTSGLVLFGSTSGVGTPYTVSSQLWEFVKVGKLVVFTLELTGISGTSPTGFLTLDLSGTDMPQSTGSFYYNVMTNGFPVVYTSIQATSFSSTSIRFNYSSSASGYNNVQFNDVDFTSTNVIISGSYITN